MGQCMKKTQRIALYGVLAALALIMSYIEMQIPAFFAVPGMKLGLTNIVVLVALYKFDAKSAFAINVVRIFVVAILFGTVMSLAFSFVGGMLSTIVMVLLKKTDRFSVVGVSIAGGLSHNIGQIIVAMILLNTNAIAWYLPILWIMGMVSGLIIGVIGALVCTNIVIKI